MQDRDEQHEAIVQSLMAHIAHYEEEEQRCALERDALKKEWDEWYSSEERHSEEATYPQLPSSKAPTQPSQFKPWSCESGRLV